MPGRNKDFYLGKTYDLEKMCIRDRYMKENDTWFSTTYPALHEEMVSFSFIYLSLIHIFQIIITCIYKKRASV